jgi:hypothetical protein
MSAPIDLWVPFFKPRLAENNVMVGEGNNSKVQVFFMMGEFQTCSDKSFIAFIDGAIGKMNRYRRDVMKSERKVGGSLLGYKISH